MALSATIYNPDLAVADGDRGISQDLALRVACHPSESPEYLITRVLAYCLEYAEGIVFGRGISEPDDPPIAVRDLTGTLLAWIEIGSPDAPLLRAVTTAARRSNGRPQESSQIKGRSPPFQPPPREERTTP